MPNKMKKQLGPETLNLMLAAAEALTGEPQQHLMSKSNSQKTAVPRQAIYLVLHNLGYSQASIAKQFNRERSSISHGIKKIRTMVSKGSGVAHFVRSLAGAYDPIAARKYVKFQNEKMLGLRAVRRFYRKAGIPLENMIII